MPRTTASNHGDIGGNSNVSFDGSLAPMMVPRRIPATAQASAEILPNINFDDFLRLFTLPLFFMEHANGSRPVANELKAMKGTEAGVGGQFQAVAAGIDLPRGVQVTRYIEGSGAATCMLVRTGSENQSTSERHNDVTPSMRTFTLTQPTGSTKGAQKAQSVDPQPVTLAAVATLMSLPTTLESSNASAPVVKNHDRSQREPMGHVEAMPQLQAESATALGQRLPSVTGEFAASRDQGKRSDVESDKTGSELVTTTPTNPPPTGGSKLHSALKSRVTRNDNAIDRSKPVVYERQGLISVGTGRLRTIETLLTGRGSDDGSHLVNAHAIPGQVVYATVRAAEGQGMELLSQSTRSVSDQVTSAVAERAMKLSRHGTTTFEMQLEPPDLGKVWVRLTDSRHGLSAKIVVASDSAMTAIESQLPSLRDSLEHAGILLRDFDVSQQPNHQFQHSNNAHHVPNADRSDKSPRDKQFPRPRNVYYTLAAAEGRVNMLA